MRVNLTARAASAEQRRSRTRTRLLDAAVRIIAEMGRETASVEDLVVAAGVARGTFYNYFPTVDALIEALSYRLIGTMGETLDVIRQSPSLPATRVAGLAHCLLGASRSDPAFAWVVSRLVGSGARRQPELEDRFDALFAEAVACGQFRTCDTLAARTLAFGAVRMAFRDLTAGDAPPAHGREVVALMLCAFGLTPGEADETSREGEALAAGDR